MDYESAWRKLVARSGRPDVSKDLDDLRVAEVALSRIARVNVAPIAFLVQVITVFRLNSVSFREHYGRTQHIRKEGQTVARKSLVNAEFPFQGDCGQRLGSIATAWRGAQFDFVH